VNKNNWVEPAEEEEERNWAEPAKEAEPGNWAGLVELGDWTEPAKYTSEQYCTILLFLMYIWSKKCSVSEHKRLISH